LSIKSITKQGIKVEKISKMCCAIRLIFSL